MVAEALGLRIDVCTCEGMRRGVPNLLRLLDRLKLRATFFATMGPDTSGRAVFNVFQQRGFFSKMVRTNAVSMYGVKTMLSGTLLPSPIVSKKCRAILRDVHRDGHEVGIHGWNHRRWQDELDAYSDEEMRAEYERAISAFEEAIGARPMASAAPAWRTSPKSLCLQEKWNFSFASDSRGYSPFYPVLDGTALKTLQIPLTLPTLDEALGAPAITLETYNEFILKQAGEQKFPVYAIHAEAEGRRYLELCEGLLRGLIGGGTKIGCLSALRSRVQPQSAKIRYGSIPGRSGILTLQETAVLDHAVRHAKTPSRSDGG